MARDLHDSVSQALYGIALGAHAAREQVERAPAKLAGTLDYILAMSATAVAEMRALVFELRPDSLEQEGLRAALIKQADALRARTGATVDVLICDDLELTADDREMLYRIAQEAMQNIAKHAQAHHVALNLQRQNGYVVLEICDDGVGFDATGRFPGHYGLKTMHERALRLRGSLEIESKPQAGAVVRARIPLADRVAA
jgi:signal transduction histidine kinase